jgi:hypothetical protein
LLKPIFQSGLAKALELLIIVPLAEANGNEGINSLPSHLWGGLNEKDRRL